MTLLETICRAICEADGVDPDSVEYWPIHPRRWPREGDPTRKTWETHLPRARIIAGLVREIDAANGNIEGTNACSQERTA